MLLVTFNGNRLKLNYLINNMDAYISGSLSGFVQIFLGHPFDTYKVWSQTGQKNTNFL